MSIRLGGEHGRPLLLVLVLVRVRVLVQVRAGGVDVEMAEDVGELDGRPDEIMAEDEAGLLALRPVCTLLPVADGIEALEIKGGGTGEDEGDEARAGCGVVELGVEDDVEGDLHLEAIARRLDEPGEGPLGIGEVGDQIVLSDGRGDATPGADGEVGTGNDGDG